MTADQNSYTVYQEFVSEFHKYISETGQLGNLLLAGYLTGSHILLEGPPGVAKTSAVKVMASLLGKETKRVQFTPDLMPADIIGYMLPLQEKGGASGVSLKFIKGPVFTDIFIADEINRAPARTQSALLEAMEERLVTVDGIDHSLDSNFWVLATENPREMEGTYPLPEAELDRFALVLRMGYQPADAEKQLALKFLNDELPVKFHDIRPFKKRRELIVSWKKDHSALIYSEALLEYAVALVRKTRESETLRYGASPRALFQLLNAAGALAVFSGRNYVDFDDIKSISVPVLAHRIKPLDAFGLELENASQHVEQLIETVPVPR